MVLEPGLVLQWTFWILGGSLFVSTLELFYILPEFRNSGLFSWRVTRTFRLKSSANLFIPRPLVDALNHRSVFPLILVLRIVTIAALYLCHFGSISFLFGISLLLLTQLVISYRMVFGKNGSDQIALILLVSLFVAALPTEGNFSQNIALYFIAGQSCLAYSSSGLAKLFSTSWRSGSALSGIMNTKTFGNRLFAKILHNRVRMSQLVGWQVIIFECLFPIVLLTTEYAWVFFLLGILFHLGVAVTMGLNSFLWSFLATYPAIYFCSKKIGL